MTLTEALAKIAAGWSPRQSITDRAVAMRGHAKAGNIARAEEYASEIEALQRAYDAHLGSKGAPMPEWAETTWQIGHAAWAEILIHGWRCGRDVWAGAGWTAGNVVGWLQIRHPNHLFTLADVIAPRDVRVAA
jgi:hypothetical protein